MRLTFRDRLICVVPRSKAQGQGRSKSVAEAGARTGTIARAGLVHALGQGLVHALGQELMHALGQVQRLQLENFHDNGGHIGCIAGACDAVGLDSSLVSYTHCANSIWLGHFSFDRQTQH